jgi:hypothetical protein
MDRPARPRRRRPPTAVAQPPRPGLRQVGPTHYEVIDLLPGERWKLDQLHSHQQARTR